LQSRFSAYPTQAIHCGLYECTEYNYLREISESFADMVEYHVLKAKVHPLIPKVIIYSLNQVISNCYYIFFFIFFFRMALEK